MTKLERCRMAKEYHEKGLNCGQSVLAAYTDVTGFTPEQSMALASGFGGGMRCGGLCGVVSACMVVLGMAHPHTLENGAEGKKRASQLAQELHRRFTARFKNLNCRDLLADTELEGTPMAAELGVTQHCRLLVVSGVELLADMLDELEAQ